ncbi:MAG TPA: hypothetical protein VI076_16760, partial [Actinopolymorphaceae bacterium]
FWFSLVAAKDAGTSAGPTVLDEIDKVLDGQPRPRLAHWKPDDTAVRITEAEAAAPGEHEIVRRLVATARGRARQASSAASLARLVPPPDSRRRKLVRAVAATPGVRWVGSRIVRVLPRRVRTSIQRGVRTAVRAGETGRR